MSILEHHFPPLIAEKYGVNAAIFLRDIYHWCSTNRDNEQNLHEGRWWTYQTIKGLCRRHPYWTKNQVEHIIKTCQEKGALLSGHFNEDSLDRTRWYTLTDEAWEMFEGPLPISEISEMHFGKDTPASRKNQKCYKDKHKTENIKHIYAQPAAQGCVQDVETALSSVEVHDDNRSAVAEVAYALEQSGYLCQCNVLVPSRGTGDQYRGRINIVATRDGKTVALSLDRKTIREKSVFMLREFPCDCRIVLLRSEEIPLPPAGIDAILPLQVTNGEDDFLRFWAAYPRKVDKQKALNAWKKLSPDGELCQVIAAALEEQKRSPQWLKDGGAYIPYPSSWLNGRRWEDESGPAHTASETEEGVTYI